MTGAGMSIDVSNTFQVFGQQQKSILIGNKFGVNAFNSSVLGMPNLDLKDEEEDC